MSDKQKITVMTFNVQHFRDYRYPNENRIDLRRFSKYIAAQGADVVGLNEVFHNGPSRRHKKQAFKVARKAGYKNAYFAKAIELYGAYSYGNALLAKAPFQGETVPIPDPSEGELNGKYAETRCVLKAKFDFNGKKLLVLCCHFGLNDVEGRNAVDTVLKIIDGESVPVLLMGDFNQVPTSPVLAPLYQRFRGTDELLGSDNATYPSDKPTDKIDYVFVRGDVRVLNAQINREVVSDHFSVKATLEL